MVTRRALLAAAVAAGCGRTRARRYFGWLFIASAGEKSVAVADLSEFRHVAQIPMPEAPGQVLRAGAKLFVTCPDAAALFEIDPETFRIVRRIAFPGRAIAAACPSESLIAVLTEQPAVLHLVDPATGRIAKRVMLPETPSGLDAAGDVAAIPAASGNSVIRVSLGAGKVAGVTALGFRPGIVRVHEDARLILAGAADRNEIATVSSASGALLARLPLAFTPLRFCFNVDNGHAGGQMFVTGTSADQIAIVSPYQSEVDQTIVAGRTPYGMAVGALAGQNLLFVTNPDSGDLTIFDIDTRQHASSVHVGGTPGEVLLTPDGEYALTVDRESGDVAVVRISTVMDRKTNIGPAPLVKPVFTIFASGTLPQSAAILPEKRSGPAGGVS